MGDIFNSLQTGLGGVAASLVAAGIVFKYVRKIVRWCKWFVAMIENVAHEFQPNSGKTMRDAINRIEVRQIATDSRVKKLEEFTDDIRNVENRKNR